MYFILIDFLVKDSVDPVANRVLTHITNPALIMKQWLAESTKAMTFDKFSEQTETVRAIWLPSTVFTGSELPTEASLLCVKFAIRLTARGVLLRHPG